MKKDKFLIANQSLQYLKSLRDPCPPLTQVMYYKVFHISTNFRAETSWQIICIMLVKWRVEKSCVWSFMHIMVTAVLGFSNEGCKVKITRCIIIFKGYLDIMYFLKKIDFPITSLKNLLWTLKKSPILFIAELGSSQRG